MKESLAFQMRSVLCIKQREKRGEKLYHRHFSADYAGSLNVAFTALKMNERASAKMLRNLFPFEFIFRFQCFGDCESD